MTTKQVALFHCAKESGVFGRDTKLERHNSAQQIAAPDWSPAGAWEYKWEEYVPLEVRKYWDNLPWEAQLMAQICAWNMMNCQTR